MGPTLPDAHLARGKPAQILEGEGAQEEGRGDAPGRHGRGGIRALREILGFTVCDDHNLSLTFLRLPRQRVKRRANCGPFRLLFGFQNGACHYFVITEKAMNFQCSKKLY